MVTSNGFHRVGATGIGGFSTHHYPSSSAVSRPPAPSARPGRTAYDPSARVVVIRNVTAIFHLTGTHPGQLRRLDRLG